MTIKEKIERKIIECLEPRAFEVINESYKHRGHAGDDGSGETHFKLLVESKVFVGLSRLERQRHVYKILADEMPYIHALTLQLSE